MSLSPISGVVLTPRVAYRLGSYAPEGTTLAVIADLSRMRARIFVSEHDLYKFKIGATARLEVDGLWGKLHGRVTSLAPKSSEFDPALAQANRIQGARPSELLRRHQMEIEQFRRASSNREWLATARIYGERRSLAGLVWQESWRFFARKLW